MALLTAQATGTAHAVDMPHAVSAAEAGSATDVVRTDAGVDPLTVLYHADVDGRLAVPRCQGGRADPPSYAALVGLMAEQRRRAVANGRSAPVVLLGGNGVGPALFWRALLQGRPPGDLGGGADLLARAGYDATALGHHELSLPVEVLDGLLRALAARGVPAIASNLRCDAGRRRACALLHPELLIERRGARVGVLATVSPAILPGIAGGRIDGITIDDPASSIRAGVRRLRARGATHILVMAQGPRDSRGLEQLETLARELGGGGPAGPDVILAGGTVDEDSGRALRLFARDGGTPVVGSAAGTAGLTRVELPSGRADAVTPSDAPAVHAEILPVDGAFTDPETAAALRVPVRGYCAAYGVALTAPPRRGPLARQSFTTFVLQLMRRVAGAEIAIINRGAVRRAPFPIAGALTRADLRDALPYAAVIGVARVTGPTVETALGRALANPKAVALGLRRTADGLQVNGRPLDKARSYRIATIAFVSAGGDAIVPPGTIPFYPLPGSPDLRDVVEGELRARRGGVNDGDWPPILGDDSEPPVNERLLMVGLTDVGLDVADTTISNTRSYGDTQLSRNQQTSLKVDATAILQVRLPLHQNDTRLNLKYGWARNQAAAAGGAAGPAVSGETVDVITFNSVYSYRGLRRARKIPRAMVPDPYGRLWLESELTRPATSATQTRDYHHLQAQVTVGALFTVISPLKVRGGGGGRQELLATGDAGRWQLVVEAGATLDPTAIATFGPLAIRLEGLFDYAFIDPAGLREHQLRASTKISVPLLPLLFVTAGADLFAVQRQQRGWGASFDSTLGLRLHFDAAFQRL